MKSPENILSKENIDNNYSLQEKMNQIKKHRLQIPSDIKMARDPDEMSLLSSQNQSNYKTFAEAKDNWNVAQQLMLLSKIPEKIAIEFENQNYKSIYNLVEQIKNLQKNISPAYSNYPFFTSLWESYEKIMNEVFISVYNILLNNEEKGKAYEMIIYYNSFLPYYRKTDSNSNLEINPNLDGYNIFFSLWDQRIKRLGSSYNFEQIDDFSQFLKEITNIFERIFPENKEELTKLQKNPDFIYFSNSFKSYLLSISKSFKFSLTENMPEYNSLLNILTILSDKSPHVFLSLLSDRVVSSADQALDSLCDLFYYLTVSNIDFNKWDNILKAVPFHKRGEVGIFPKNTIFTKPDDYVPSAPYIIKIDDSSLDIALSISIFLYYEFDIIYRVTDINAFGISFSFFIYKATITNYSVKLYSDLLKDDLQVPQSFINKFQEINSKVNEKMLTMKNILQKQLTKDQFRKIEETNEYKTLLSFSYFVLLEMLRLFVNQYYSEMLFLTEEQIQKKKDQLSLIDNLVKKMLPLLKDKNSLPKFEEQINKEFEVLKSLGLSL